MGRIRCPRVLNTENWETLLNFHFHPDMQQPFSFSSILFVFCFINGCPADRASLRVSRLILES